MKKAVELKNIYKVFGQDINSALKMIDEDKSKKDILDQTGCTIGINNISLDVNMGEFFVLMGLSGSGKSTLIRHINNLIEPTRGEVWALDQNVLAMDKRQLMDFRRHHISMVFQRFALLPHKNIIENVAFGLFIRGEQKEAAYANARKWIERVGLKGYEEQRPRQLSGGMQQRVGIARALATDPKILLMDEPFSALDPLIRNEMQDIMKNLQDELQTTTIFVTHDLDEAMKLADRMAILKDGESVQVGTPDEIRESPANDYVKRFIQGQGQH